MSIHANSKLIFHLPVKKSEKACEYTFCVTPVTEVCNLSVRPSAFPNQCEIAKLKPLFKNGSKTEAKNYQPVSVFHPISEVVERIIYDQSQFSRQK